MKRYSLTHLSNETLRSELSNKAASEKEATAELIAHIAEFDARELYLPAAYGSMLTYCLGSWDSPRTKPRSGSESPGLLDAVPRYSKLSRPAMSI